MGEAVQHPHMAARGAVVERDGVLQPAPSPRFSRTPAVLPPPPGPAGGQTRAALGAWGFTDEEVAALEAGGVAVQA